MPRSQAIGEFWLTWPLQYPLSLLMEDAYSLIRYVARLAPLPLLAICSEIDEIVPARHSLALFEAAGEPKQLLMTRGPHIATFLFPENCRRVLAFLEETRKAGMAINRPN